MIDPKDILSNFDIGLFISYLFGILGVIGLYQAYKYNHRKKLEGFWWKNYTLIDPVSIDVPNIFIYVNNDPVSKIHQLKVFLKNTGNQTITKSDIIDHVEILFNSPIKIVHFSVFSTNSYNSKFNVLQLDRGLKFDFDFLEKKDYLRVDIYYESQQQRDGYVKGKIIGFPEINYHFGTNSLQTETEASIRYSSNLNVLMIIFIIFLATEVLILMSIFKVSFHEASLLGKYMDSPVLTWTYVLTVLGMLLLLMLPLYFTYKLNWIIKPFYLTIDEIKSWHKKTFQNSQVITVEKKEKKRKKKQKD